ncbi:hypothetical protein DPMN_175615 [Dreissena polymorpha]|uniref:Uncharacterized protein n=1 Tax=Dreissena polymorpha TaxID=45954 RepID=A0A9D4E9F2_DREPO|nr:hypothetical protein DPMN_175615 [Dreissena polymorpha]
MGKNLLAKFHEDWLRNVTKKAHVWKTTLSSHPHPGFIVFQQTGRIFKLDQEVIRTSVLTKFHLDCTKNLITREKNAALPGGLVFQKTGTIFALSLDIIKTIVLKKFHEN